MKKFIPAVNSSLTITVFLMVLALNEEVLFKINKKTRHKESNFPFFNLVLCFKLIKQVPWEGC